jgi:hypothetical protein
MTSESAFRIRISDARGCFNALHAFKAVNVAQPRSRERSLLVWPEGTAKKAGH